MILFFQQEMKFHSIYLDFCIKTHNKKSDCVKSRSNIDKNFFRQTPNDNILKLFDMITKKI